MTKVLFCFLFIVLMKRNMVLGRHSFNRVKPYRFCIRSVIATRCTSKTQREILPQGRRGAEWDRKIYRDQMRRSTSPRIWRRCQIFASLREITSGPSVTQVSGLLGRSLLRSRYGKFHPAPFPDNFSSYSSCVSCGQSFS